MEQAYTNALARATGHDSSSLKVMLSRALRQQADDHHNVPGIERERAEATSKILAHVSWESRQLELYAELPPRVVENSARRLCEREGVQCSYLG